MTITDSRGMCPGRYRPGSAVYLADMTTAPLIVLSMAVGVSPGAIRVQNVYAVQTRKIEEGVSFWVAEQALISLAIRVVTARDATTSETSDGLVVIRALGGCPPFAYKLSLNGSTESDSGWHHGITAEIRELRRGEYTIEAKDVNGLRATRTVVIYDTECRNAKVSIADGTQCIACCAAPRGAVLLPCCHLGLCAPCARMAIHTSRKIGAPNGTCPFCRGLVCGFVGAIWA
jgi:hypothetical protein